MSSTVTLTPSFGTMTAVTASTQRGWLIPGGAAVEQVPHRMLAGSGDDRGSARIHGSWPSRI
jgi:hypothetical protein